MKTQGRSPRVAAVLFVLFCLSTLKTHLYAQNAAASDGQAAAPSQPNADAPSLNDQDPSGRVARLSFMEGAVTFQPSGEKDWFDAELNRPLVSGDNLWADQNSKAELHLGSTALHLDSMTGITLLEVSDHALQVRLVQGSLIFKVRHIDGDDAYEIDTPNVAFVAAQSGAYRIDVSPDGTTTDVTVWRGRGEVTGGGSSYTIVANQRATFTGAEQLTYDLTQLPGSDGFATWAQRRDQMEDESDSANYVSPETTGYEDLDQYGDWSYVAGYGMVWRPRALGVDWAPYRFGHWAWIAPWGWTWVEAEPWGFAPFHYGRWAFVGANWMWVPGPAAVRPIYSPALVAWVGGGPGSHSAFSFGAGVGWVPLAPGEVFLPYYPTSRTYLNSVNLTNTHLEITKVTNVYNTLVVNRSTAPKEIAYANRDVAGGVTVVSRETFVNARPVARNVVRVSAKELAAVPVSGSVGVEPSRASIIGGGGIAANQPPAALVARQVVAVRNPAPIPAAIAQGPILSVRNSNSAVLVRQQQRANPVAMPSAAIGTATTPRGLHSVDSSGDTVSNSAADNHGRAVRVWEEQGTPEPTSSAPQQSSSHYAQPNGTAALKPASSRQRQTGLQSSPTTAKPAPSSQTKSEQPQKEPRSAWHQTSSWSSAEKASRASSSVRESAPPQHK